MTRLSHWPDTRIDEIGNGIYRISTAVGPDAVPGGFSFNQYLIVDDAPLLFHTGPRRIFAATAAAIATVMPVTKLRYVGFSHHEADESGALNEFLAVAPSAQPVCSQIGAMTSIGDLADRAPHALADGDTLSLGRMSVRWLDTPHLPHGWDCGYLFETTSSTLFCGDLFTQAGSDTAPLTTSDILAPSEAMRGGLDYFSHGRDTPALLEKLAQLRPTTLACMHGSAWTGDGATLLRSLARVLAG
jgi:flavorubredoxin